jgi:AcrR family transcriptional regulator
VAAEWPETSRPSRRLAASELLLLLEYGLSSISMDAVAERAGTSTATIYRCWR